MKKAFAVFALIFASHSLSLASNVFKCQPEALKAAYDHYLYANGQDAMITLNIYSAETQDDSIYYRIEILNLETQSQTDSWVKVEANTCKVLGIH